MNNHIKISLALLSVPLCQAAAKENKNDRPNIVIIYCDDMGYGDDRASGYKNTQSGPNGSGWYALHELLQCIAGFNGKPLFFVDGTLSGSCRFPVGLESGCGERYSSSGIDNSRTSEGTRLCYGYLW